MTALIQHKGPCDYLCSCNEDVRRGADVETARVSTSALTNAIRRAEAAEKRVKELEMAMLSKEAPVKDASLCQAAEDAHQEMIVAEIKKRWAEIRLHAAEIGSRCGIHARTEQIDRMRKNVHTAAAEVSRTTSAWRYADYQWRKERAAAPGALWNNPLPVYSQIVTRARVADILARLP